MSDYITVHEDASSGVEDLEETGEDPLDEYPSEYYEPEENAGEGSWEGQSTFWTRLRDFAEGWWRFGVTEVVPWLRDGGWRIAGLLSLLSMLSLAPFAYPRLCALQQSLTAAVTSTPRPGADCDSAKDRWVKRGAATSITCVPEGTVLRFAAGSSGLGELAYLVGKDNQKAQNYSISVVGAIAPGSLGTSIGIAAHGQQPGAQLASVNAQGYWRLERWSSKPEKLLASGYTAPASEYRLELAVIGETQLVFTINGRRVASVQDSEYSKTLYVLLTMEGIGSGAVAFQNFQLTFNAPPLPMCSSGDVS